LKATNVPAEIAARFAVAGIPVEADGDADTSAGL
jgi:hypothetical protein